MYDLAHIKMQTHSLGRLCPNLTTNFNFLEVAYETRKKRKAAKTAAEDNLPDTVHEIDQLLFTI